MSCKYCAEYFPRWSCGANRDTGECDCPKCQGICECSEEKDPIVESVRQKLLERSQRGFEKYGTNLTRDDLKRVDWLRHAQEEALDLANYLERLIQKT